MRASIGIAVALALFAGVAVAGMGFLVGQNMRMVGGTTYMICTYQVGTDRIDLMQPYPSVCQPSHNF